MIEAERPDSIMLSFGGQTALNCGVALHKEGILKKYGIKVLGTQVKGIEITEDRQLFKEAMIKSNVSVLQSAAVYTLSEAIKITKEIGYPVIIRVAYTLGGEEEALPTMNTNYKKLFSVVFPLAWFIKY